MNTLLTSRTSRTVLSFSVMPSFELKVQQIRHPDTIYILQVRWWNTIKDIKDLIRNVTHAKPSQIRIFHPCEPVQLRNAYTLHDIGLDNTGSILRVAIDGTDNSNFVLSYSDSLNIDEPCLAMVKAVENGLERNVVPAKSDLLDGTSGVYFMRSVNGAYVAVFKPRDEEQGMPNNPKEHADVGDASLRDDFKPGEGCFREQAAYILDVDNFCRVPPTMLVHCEHPVFNYPNHSHSRQTGRQIVKPFPKYGSLQHYIRSEDSFENFGRNFFSDVEVQRIALLDIRLLNCDRNSANILVHRKSHHDEFGGTSGSDRSSPNSQLDDDMHFSSGPENDVFETEHSPHHSGDDYYLVPIDHGYALPCRLKIFQWDWAWFDYDQVNRPVCPEILAYVRSLDIDRIVSDLRTQVVLPEDSFFLVRVAHQLLVEGLEAGLTLRDIADLITREDEDVPSRLELAILEAEDNALHTLEAHWATGVKGLRINGDHLASVASSSPHRNGHVVAPKPVHEVPLETSPVTSPDKRRQYGSCKVSPHRPPLFPLQETDVDDAGDCHGSGSGKDNTSEMLSEANGTAHASMGQTIRRISTIDAYSAASKPLPLLPSNGHLNGQTKTTSTPSSASAYVSPTYSGFSAIKPIAIPPASLTLTQQDTAAIARSPIRMGGIQASCTSADLCAMATMGQSQSNGHARNSSPSLSSRGPTPPPPLDGLCRENPPHIPTGTGNGNGYGAEYDAVPLSRAVSFTALESAPLFELKSLNKHRANAVLLKRQRNKQLEATVEYRDQRMQFTAKTVSVLVSRATKQLTRKKSM